MFIFIYRFRRWFTFLLKYHFKKNGQVTYGADMKDILVLLAIFAGVFILMKVVIPKLGISP